MIGPRAAILSCDWFRAAILTSDWLLQVKHTRVADLTVSEKRRLNVACHLQLDTDIVILDQVLERWSLCLSFMVVWPGPGF